MIWQVGDTHADWHGHVIVCGLPGVGLRIVEQLALSGVPAVVVDPQPDPGQPADDHVPVPVSVRVPHLPDHSHEGLRAC
jgi:voltage-gated potassium channel Kch